MRLTSPAATAATIAPATTAAIAPAATSAGASAVAISTCVASSAVAAECSALGSRLLALTVPAILRIRWPVRIVLTGLVLDILAIDIVIALLLRLPTLFVLRLMLLVLALLVRLPLLALMLFVRFPPC